MGPMYSTSLYLGRPQHPAATHMHACTVRNEQDGGAELMPAAGVAELVVLWTSPVCLVVLWAPPPYLSCSPGHCTMKRSAK